MTWRYDSKTQEFKRAILRGSNVMVDAANEAVKKTAAVAVQAGRQNIAAAGFGSRWVNSLVFKMMTPKGSKEPLAYIHTKGNLGNIASVFEEGADIQGEPTLWLPLPSVPGAGRRKHMTPQQYIKNIGPLIKLKLPGGRKILAAVIKRGVKAQPFGKFATKGQLKRGRNAKTGTIQTIPLYVGVDAVHIGKKWNVVAAMANAAKKMPQIYEDEVKKNEGTSS